MKLDFPVPIDLRERNKERTKEAIARLGDRYCLHPSKRIQRQWPHAVLRQIRKEQP